MVIGSRGSSRAGRTPAHRRYNVLHVDRAFKIGKESFDVSISKGQWWWNVAVYRSFSGRFVAAVRLAPADSYRLKWLDFWRYTLSFIERSRPRDDGGPAAPTAVCKWLSKSCPAVHEYLTVGVLPSGEVRQPSTLTFFVEGNLFKCCLHEKDANANLFASGTGLEECLDNLEERLTAAVVDWRRKSGQNGRMPPKKG